MFFFSSSSRGNHELADMFLKRGADVNLPDNQVITPLALATGLGYWQVVKVLVAHPETNVNCQV